MDADAGQADQAEQQEARRDGVVGELCRHQRRKIERDLGIELAFAVLALAEGRWQLDVRRLPRAVARMSSRILKPCESTATARGLRSASRRIMKWPLIGSVRSMPSKRRTSVFEPAADARALFRKPGGRPAIEIAARHGHIGASRAQRLRASATSNRLVMLKVGVHHGHVAGLARQHALEAGAGEAAPADAADAADAAIARADGARGRGRAVRRVVVDENNLPVARPSRSCASRSTRSRNIGLFVEGRNDDGEFRRGPHGGARVRARKRGRRACRRSPVYRRLRQVSALHATRIVALCVGAGY